MEFVSISHDIARSGRSAYEADVQTRIRTHVMRQYRRRQRGEPEDPPKPSEQGFFEFLVPSYSSVRTKAPDRSSRKRLLSKSSTCSGAKTADVHESGSTRDPRSRSREANDQNNLSVCSLPCSAKQRPNELLMPRTPNSWPSRSSGLNSPMELQQSVALAIAYYQWTVPGLTSDQAFETLNAIAYSQRALVDVLQENTLATLDASTYKGLVRMHLSSMCLASISSTLHTPKMRATSGLDGLFKLNVLQGVQRNLKQSATGTSQSTLGALVGLTLFDLNSGSSDALVHLQGVDNILKLQGGLHYQGYGGGLRKHIELVDLIYAVRACTEPVYTTTSISSFSPVQELGAMRDATLEVHHDYPMRGTDLPSIAWQYSMQNGDASIQDALSNDLSGRQRLMAGFFSSELINDPVILHEATSASASDIIADERETYRTIAKRWQSYLLATATSADTTDDLAVVCRFAIGLLNGDMQSQDLYLSTMLCSMDESRWGHLRSAYIRLILLALVHTDSKTQQAQLSSELNRQVSQLKLFDWLIIKLVFLEFISMRIASKKLDLSVDSLS